MELKPGYKQTDMGLLPSEWEVIQLGTFVKITSGSSPSLFRFSTSGIPYFKVEQLSNSDKYLGAAQTPYQFEIGPVVEAKSVVFAKRGAAIALNKVRILSEKSFMDTNIMALTPLTGLDSDYLFYAIGFIGLWRFADTTSVPQINNKHVKPLAFPLPTVKEQRLIVQALSDIDALLDSLDRLIAKKRDLKQAAMQQLLTGKTRLPGFSGDWEVKRLGDVAILKNGYAFKSNTYSNLGAFNVITIANVQDGFMEMQSCNKISSEPSDLQPHQRLSRGDILISMTGNVGRVCHVNEDNCLLNQRVGKLVPVGLSETFLFLLLRQASFTSAMADVAKGGAQPNLSASDITNYLLHVPTELSEQAAICDMLTVMNEEIEMLGKRRNKTAALKQGMMQELLTGRTRLV
jgi:type I restriction enzyme S subunit